MANLARETAYSQPPKLAAQHARYVRMTLQHYKTGKRTTDNNARQPIKKQHDKLWLATSAMMILSIWGLIFNRW